MNIAVAVSGGADSLYALLALREQGHHVTALHARFLPVKGHASAPAGAEAASSPGMEACSPVPSMVERADAADAANGLTALCAALDIPLRVTDMTADFAQTVIRPFVDAHAMARTPNPCALCNRAMKFGRLLDEALNREGLAADALATGHYVQMADHPRYGRTLRAGQDPAKDQSYFLALTPAERLLRCVFPLADKRKTDILAWLARHGVVPPTPKESQEICFVPHDDHRAFLEAAVCRPGYPALPGPGPVLLEDPAENAPGMSDPPDRGPGRSTKKNAMVDGMPVIGRHQGLWRYTEGQRRGLGIAWSEPLFVLRRDRRRNALIVGPASRIGAFCCEADNINLMTDPALWPDRLLARIRYRQAPAPVEARVEHGPEGPILRLRFAEAQLPPAPGQVAAVYDEDGFVLAGGILREQYVALPERAPMP